jgi:SET family sugar efflux transporter-like MFS transporter
MPFRSSLALLKVPYFAPTMSALLVYVLAEAVGGTYMALLAVEKIGMSALELGLFLTLSSLSGMVLTTLLGGLFDRRPALWPLLVTLLAKVVAFALVGFVTAPWMLIVIGVTLMGLGSGSFAMFFAIAKGQLDQADAQTSARGMATLRLLSSLGWAIGPAMGAGLVALGSFPAVFVGAAALTLVALATVVATGLKVMPASTAVRQKLSFSIVRQAAPGAVALTLFHMTMFMASTAMMIIVVRELGSETDIGLLLSLCAGLEVLVMGLFVVRPMARVSHGLLIAGFLIFAAYFAVPLVFPTLAALYFGQVLRAVAIAIISILGMAYIQELLPGRPGAAAALFGNTMSAGALLSGLGTGLWANAFGFWSIFGLSCVLALIGALAILIGRPRRQEVPKASISG